MNKVYVKTDSDGRVLEINSDAFLTSIDGYTEIDSGEGDKYYHAQGNYLIQPVMDERGVYRYALTDGAVRERTQAEMDADYIETEKHSSLEDRMNSVEEQLDILISGATEDE